ncbi:TetR/AcrR family transcriptional regulator [Amycolatopsis saalfeldensis]|uniref:DNA-binding transcriptional regulator, AcrR family n=1 Tax=Amycolatopsis saalfeldensis TaxID=394193 RepID=A0A1H8YNA6_9PSEU|nr:TetR/AcrR family transcriptional regulator [Amycolatopsis saalfeldensis]SEP53563.1 DNA-binding transcriptional regulator, AcrR family [Amycolatopsis saalfeldensis]
MSPRGVAITDLRHHLFRAAERVLAREGPGGLTGRAITREAGCATGLLYNHFGSLDDFLTEFAVERARLAARGAEELPARAGTGTVAGNLTEAALALPVSDLPALAALMASRPALAPRVREALEAGAPGLDEIEKAFGRYLDVEKALGRIAADLDTEAFALALVGTVHHLLHRYSPGGLAPAGKVRRVVAALAARMAPTDGDRTVPGATPEAVPPGPPR